jgi:hypothetical protein
MNISWVIADSAELDPTQNIDALKRLGPIWGSWRTWRAYQTDNVVCHNQSKAEELVRRKFHERCNFYISDSVNASLGRPAGVRLYAGDFVHDVIRQEEIVALHLAATTSDIVLLLGWDLNKLKPTSDRLESNQAQHHRNLFHQAVKDYSQTQWVAVDHLEPLAPSLQVLENLVLDTMDTVLALSPD